MKNMQIEERILTVRQAITVRMIAIENHLPIPTDCHAVRINGRWYIQSTEDVDCCETLAPNSEYEKDWHAAKIR